MAYARAIANSRKQLLMGYSRKLALTNVTKKTLLVSNLEI